MPSAGTSVRSKDDRREAKTRVPDHDDPNGFEPRYRGRGQPASVVDSELPTTKCAAVKPTYPYPRKTLQDALRIANALKVNNGGNESAPTEVAKAPRVGGKTGNYFGLVVRCFGHAMPP